MSLHDIVVYAYAATFVCVLIVEISKRARTARAAAYASLILVTIGSSVWTYAAYLNRAPPADGFWHVAQQASSGSGDLEDDDGDPGPHSVGGGGGRRGSAKVQPSAVHSGDTFSEFADTGVRSVQTATRAAARRLGLIAVSDDTELAVDKAGAFRDCPYCPDLVAVPAGNQLIGAADDDGQATAAEKPQRLMRVWPGYAIGATAVTAESFNLYLKDNNRAPEVCRATGGAARPDDGSNFASCVTALDADGYVSWLTARTGMPFRLPTAAEWEYAVRAVQNPAFKIGDVAEIVSDCWLGVLPSAGLDLIAVANAAADCPGRIVMGAGRYDAAVWQRPSARRRLNAAPQPADVGLRVIRDQR